MTSAELLGRLEQVKGRAPTWTACCPAHEDESPSLSVTETADRLLVKCHAGCPQEAVVGALGLGMKDLFTSNGTHPAVVAEYDYVDADGVLRYQVVRFFPKDFRQRRPDGAGGWIWNLRGVGRLLYRLPRVLEAVAAGKRVFLVEGEKDVHAIEAAGHVATTNAGGAGKWRDSYNTALAGADVVIVADKDPPGYAHAAHVGRSLDGIARRVMVVEPAQGKDVFDHLAAGLQLRDLAPVAADPTATEVPVPAEVLTLTPRPAPEAGERRLPLSDLGNADAFLATHGDRIRFVPAWRSWLLWDERRWKPDDVAGVEALAKEHAAKFLADAAAVRTADGGPDKALVQHALKSQDARRIRAMLEVAAMDRAVTLRPDALDAEPFALTCANGILDLATGELGPHDPTRLLTKATPVAYDASARSDLWDGFLARVLPDPDARGFFQRAIGYSLTGDVREESLFLPHGPGANGKSTAMETIRSAFGDVARTADCDSFRAGRPVGGPRNDIAALAGARLVASVEVEDGRTLAAALVKVITGGDTITARRLYQESFEFRPCLKLWLVCNHAPGTRDDDPALWRRIHRIPFDVVIPEAERDPSLKAQLRQSEHQAAVLAWAVEGCLRWQRDGLTPPPVIRAATAQYRLDQDPLAEFLGDCCTLDPEASATKKAFREAYTAYCTANGDHRPIGAKRLKESLLARGITEAKSMSARLWRGVAVTSPHGEDRP